MLARKVLDLAEQQGLLDVQAIAELRRRLAETKFVVTPEAIAKVLVDHGHLTPFQARKLVSQALGPEPAPAARKSAPEEDLTFSEPDDVVELEPAADEEEIVELEAVAPPPSARPAKPAPKPAPPTTEVVKPSRKERKPLAETVPAVADEDLVGLTPLPAGPPPSAPKWKGQTPQPPADGLASLDDLAELPPDPLGAAAEQSGAMQPIGQRPVKKNVWDSKLLLIGGGLLGVLVIAFGVLLYSLTFGTAAEMFEKIEADYRSGSYSNAIAGYDKFLERYASDPHASLARVHRGMAQVRQVTDGGKNPHQGLQIVQQVLPQIESEKDFNDARTELASILPDLADGFATQASQATDLRRKEDLVKQAGEAMQLVNNPSYLPASLRKDRENRITSILDKLKLAQRSIDQDKDLLVAIDKIGAAAEKGDARTAYQVRDELVRTYPALETNADLVAAVVGVGESERKLVKVTEGGAKALTDDVPATSSKVIIAVRDAPAGSAAGKPVFVLVEGSAYGLDAASGRVLWRRFIGYESMIWPVTLPAGTSSDALVVDSRTNELLRISGATGQHVWRQAADAALTAPLPVGERILVTTRLGKILALEAATGNPIRSAQLPQGAGVGIAAGGQPTKLLQLGEHSTLFVLNADTLACTETVYLGHKAGAIFVPPAAVLDQVLVVESPADDFSLVHVLSPDSKTKKLVELGRPLRLKGRVLTPLAVKGRRVAAVTDLGQVAVYEVDASNPQQPVRLLAGQDASERSPALPQLTFDGNRLWTASRRCALLEVQGALQQLNRKWTAYQDDVFLGPMTVQDDLLVHVRRQPGGAAVLVEASGASDGRTVWTTHLASPVVGLAVSESRKTVDLLTSEGRLFSLGTPQLQAGSVDAPTFAPPVGSGRAILPYASLSADDSQMLWTDADAGGRSYAYNVTSGGAPASATLPAGAQAAAVAQLFGTRWLVPLSNGSVVLLDAGAASTAVQPFLPPLEPSSLPLWTRPAVAASGDSFMISDGRGKLYSVALRNQPQPHLAEAAAATTDGPVASPIVLAGSTFFGVARRESNDALLGFDAQAQSAFNPVALSGRCQAGPFAAGGLVLLTVEPDGLLCFEGSGKQRWQQPLKHGPLAGPPVICPDGDLLLIHQRGKVTRIDPASGAELSQHDVAQPLGGAARILGASVFLAGSDGVLHRIALPPRP